MGNQKPQTKNKERTDNDEQNATQTTEDRATRIPLRSPERTVPVPLVAPVVILL